MNKKILTIIFGIIFIIGGVFAANSLSNTTDIQFPSGVVAGSTFTANFSFEYLDNYENEDNSALIIKLNITSDNPSYPVWKGDFEISDGKIEKYSLFGFLKKTVYFNCTDSSPYTIQNTLGVETINNISNGTFYCYSEDGNLNLEEKDEVFLNMKSNPAIWPGDYSMTASFFYLNDTTAPIIQIINKSYFDRYFRDGSYVDFNVTINDGNLITDYRAKIVGHTPEISFSKEWIENNIYHFYQTLPNSNELIEGNYLINATATDIAGNTGSDNVVIKFDLTSPDIKLIEPLINGTIHDETLQLKVNVTDAKSGVDESEVYYRLREMNGTDICPGEGVGTWNCTNTGWLNLDYNSASLLYEKEINTTKLNLDSGEYWLDIKASDILGNTGYL